MTNRVLNVKELSEMFKISRSKAFELVHTEGFPKLRIGRRILVPRNELESWISENLTKSER